MLLTEKIRPKLHPNDIKIQPMYRFFFVRLPHEMPGHQIFHKITKVSRQNCPETSEVSS